MSDQLEAEVQETLELDSPIEEVEAQTEQVSETVSDSGDNHEEKPTFTPEQKATAEYAFKAREAKRENEELKRQLAEANQPKSVGRPEVPDLQEFPEPEEIKAFQEATQNAAVWDYQYKQQKEADYNAQVVAQNQQNEALHKTRSDFVSNATIAGIKLEDLQMAGNIVDNQGLHPSAVHTMMTDKDGGTVLLHLATNEADTVALNRVIDDRLAFAETYNAIKAKAATLKPKQSEAPQPAELLDGAGAPKQDGGPKGATYE